MTPRTVIKYPGAKWSVAQWIISTMPPHKSYLEPFFGSGAVFFNKPPSRIETINDLDSEIVNLFTVIRDRAADLERTVALTPYSREVYDAAWESLKDQEPADPVERARRTLIRYWQTHGSRTLYKGGWKNDRAGRECAYAAQYWNRLPAWISESTGRLKEAQIEHMPAVECIRRFRSPEVLIYADPPYLLSTRKQRQYRVEMEGDEQHEELLKVLLDHPGPVMLSGYDSDLYNDTLRGWMKLQHEAKCEYGGKRTEVLWINYEPQMSLI